MALWWRYSSWRIKKMKQMHILSTLVGYAGPNNIKRATFCLKKIPSPENKSNVVGNDKTRHWRIGPHILWPDIYSNEKTRKPMAVKKKGEKKILRKGQWDNTGQTK